jgi:hypothetical protein
VLLLLLYTTFSVPYLLAFVEDPPLGSAPTAFDIWDLCLDIIFCLDIVLSFVTAFVRNGVYIQNLRLIAKNYLS